MKTYRHKATGKVVNLIKRTGLYELYIYQATDEPTEYIPGWVIKDSAAWIEQKQLITEDLTTEEIIIPIGAKYRLEGVAATFTNDGTSVASYVADPPVEVAYTEPSPDWRVPGAWGWHPNSEAIFRINKIGRHGLVFVDENWIYTRARKTWKSRFLFDEQHSRGHIPATPEQIKKYLVEEAERRGYKKGVKLAGTGIREGFGEGQIGTILTTDLKFFYDPKEDRLNLDCRTIYQRGQWAEIVKEESKPEETYWKCLTPNFQGYEMNRIYPGSHKYFSDAPLYESKIIYNMDKWEQVEKSDYDNQDNPLYSVHQMD